MAFKVGDIVQTKVPMSHHPVGSPATIVRVENTICILKFDDDSREYHFLTSELAPMMTTNNKIQFILPKGYVNFDSGNPFDAYIGDWEYPPIPEPKEDKPKVKCECGTSKTLEGNDDPQFHSTWCPVYKERK